MQKLLISAIFPHFGQLLGTRSDFEIFAETFVAESFCRNFGSPKVSAIFPHFWAVSRYSIRFFQTGAAFQIFSKKNFRRNFLQKVLGQKYADFASFFDFAETFAETFDQFLRVPIMEKSKVGGIKFSSEPRSGTLNQF